jgi:hypothetical protein
MRLVARLLTVAVLASLPLSVSGQRSYGFRTGVYPNVAYDTRFTFSRIRYDGYGFRRGGNSWSHDYPDADLNLPAILKALTSLRPTIEASNVFRLEDPEIFRHPVLYVSEPGFWAITDEGAANLRDHLLKGGFIIFDDFEAGQWYNFEAAFRRALPEAEFFEIDERHPIFHAFFDIDDIDVPHPLVRVDPVYLAVFEDNDPDERMIALVNYNNDLAEYWEFSGTGRFPVDTTNEAYKLGVNYIIYGIVH